MTTRDLEIIEFLDEYKVATTTQLCHFFFKGKASCYKTLQRLYEAKQINRMKIVEGFVNSEYIYFHKKPPSQLRHALALVEFYYKFDMRNKVDEFDVQKKLGTIIPDAIMRYDEKEALVEVELSKKGFDYMKYEKFYISGEYKNFFQNMPEVLVYGNAKIPTNTRIKYKVFGNNNNKKKEIK